MTQIVAVCLDELIYMADDGTIGEITNLFDADGEETTDARKAVSAVARSPNGWWSIDLTQFERATLQ